jgi:hypothetical protein
MTGEYTFVAPERQNELTRRIQQKLAAATKKGDSAAPIQVLPPPTPPPPQEAPPSIAELQPVTSVVQ